MTREEKKRLRMQIIQLLDECDDCEHKTRLGSSTTVCRQCPIGKQLITLSERLEKPKRVSKPWSDDEEMYLAENYDKMRYKNIAEKLGRTQKAIKAKVKQMRLAGLIQEKKTNNKLSS